MRCPTLIEEPRAGRLVPDRHPGPGLPDAQAKALSELLERLRLDDDTCWTLVPAWCRRATDGETAAAILAKLLFWWGPRQATERSRVVRARTGLYDEQSRQCIPATDEELARQTGLEPKSCGFAIRSLAKLGIVELTIGPDGGRRAYPHDAMIERLYRRLAGDVPDATEYDEHGIGPRWCASRAAEQAMRSGTVLHPLLVRVTADEMTTRRNGQSMVRRVLRLLEARLLGQVLYRFRPDSPAPPTDGWWKTTLGRLSDELGVCDDSVAAALSRLHEQGLLRRITHRTGRHITSVATWFYPRPTQILKRLEALK